MEQDSYIPIAECRSGYLYRIDSRNASFGIYDAENECFIISRTKFYDNFLDEEDHWDTGIPCGTVKPLELIEEAPEFSSEIDVLNYLNKKYKELKEKS